MDSYLKRQKVTSSSSSAVIDLVDSDEDDQGGDIQAVSHDDTTTAPASHIQSSAEYSTTRMEDGEGENMARSLISCFDEIAESEKTQSEFDSPSGKIEWHAFTQQPCSQEEAPILASMQGQREREERAESQRPKPLNEANHHNLRVSSSGSSHVMVDHTNENPAGETNRTGSPEEQRYQHIESSCKTCSTKRESSADDNGDAVLKLLRSMEMEFLSKNNLLADDTDLILPREHERNPTGRYNTPNPKAGPENGGDSGKGKKGSESHSQGGNPSDSHSCSRVPTETPLKSCSRSDLTPHQRRMLVVLATVEKGVFKRYSPQSSNRKARSTGRTCSKISMKSPSPAVDETNDENSPLENTQRQLQFTNKESSKVDQQEKCDYCVRTSPSKWLGRLQQMEEEHSGDAENFDALVWQFMDELEASLSTTNGNQTEANATTNSLDSLSEDQIMLQALENASQHREWNGFEAVEEELIDWLTKEEPSASYEPRNSASNMIRGVVTHIAKLKRSMVLHVSVGLQKPSMKTVLNGIWAETEVHVGDVVNIIVTEKVEAKDINEICVTDQENALIVLPDQMLSPSKIASSFDCERRTVLNEIAISGSASKPAIIGELKHMLFEYAISAERWEKSALEDFSRTLLKRPGILSDLYCAGMSGREALDEISKAFTPISQWCHSFFESKSQREDKQKKFTVATEYELSGSKWGMKGVIDAVMRESPQTTLLELKTGKLGETMHVNHRAQVALYECMFSDQQHCDSSGILQANSNGSITSAASSPKSGILLYLGQEGKGESGTSTDRFRSFKVPFVWKEVACLLIQRNRVAKMLSKIRHNPLKSGASDIEDGAYRLPSLPPMVDNASQCDYCSVLPYCTLLGSASPLSLENLFSQTLRTSVSWIRSRLGVSDFQYLRKWWSLMTEEENYSSLKLRTSGVGVNFLGEDSNTVKKGYENLVASRGGHWLAPVDQGNNSSVWPLHIVGMEEVDCDDLFSSLDVGFRRPTDSEFALEEYDINVGDRVTLSIPKLQLGISVGNVTSVRRNSCRVQFSHNLASFFRMVSEERAIGKTDTFSQYRTLIESINSNFGWRIDRDEISNLGRIAKTNMLRLFVGAFPELYEGERELVPQGLKQHLDFGTGHTFLRRLLTGDGLNNDSIPRMIGCLPWEMLRMSARDAVKLLKEAQYVDLSKRNAIDHAEQLLHNRHSGDHSNMLELPSLQTFLSNSSTLQRLETEFKDTLNSDQKKAVSSVFSCQEGFLCLQGMPGTGKTMTIAFIVRALTSFGFSVLVSAFTHSAVDNVVLKLLSSGVDVLRLGREAAVHPDVRSSCFDNKAKSREANTVGAIRELVEKTQVVATTAMGMNHQLLRKRSFDFCIVDEASQILEPICLGPLLAARRFVLVGDAKQLPPLVSSPASRKAGLDVSLFQRLTSKYPFSLVFLRYQYRMNEDIQTLANSLVYEGKLKCANSTVKDGCYRLPKLSSLSAANLQDMSFGSCVRALGKWLGPESSVVFLDTDSFPDKSQRQERRLAHDDKTVVNSKATSGGITNVLEAETILTILAGIALAGGDLSDVGVASPYRAQLRLLHQMFQGLSNKYDLKGTRWEDIEISTIDRFQGRDKSVIIMSFVRSNEPQEVGRLLNDLRRINVALTRAKTKLFLLGSLTTLSTSPLLSSLLQLVQGRNNIVQFPPQWNNQKMVNYILSASSLSRNYKSAGRTKSTSQKSKRKLKDSYIPQADTALDSELQTLMNKIESQQAEREQATGYEGGFDAIARPPDRITVPNPFNSRGNTAQSKRQRPTSRTGSGPYKKHTTLS
eukprot:gb/GECG01009626.1/.p1 GENE.gb/GECG01009626.1/~~gb/GECG01009626.1/.p1  ORF type:complete len:1798 (+),score=229.80 gb/GECG01009626.1/:1-5394(+)